MVLTHFCFLNETANSYPKEFLGRKVNGACCLSLLNNVGEMMTHVGEQLYKKFQQKNNFEVVFAKSELTRILAHHYNLFLVIDLLFS